MHKIPLSSLLVHRLAVVSLLAIILISAPALARVSGPLIVDQSCTDITVIPEAAINQAKADLHIAYGHTSHGSQLTDGMTGLVAFANGGGLGLSLPTDIFTWNDGGIGGALDLHDYAMAGDLDYYPQWVENTRDYLGAPESSTGRGTSQPGVNVIVWAWCSALDDKYNAGTIDSEYLIPMSQLEIDYPGVVFVYMTSHTNHGKHPATAAGNQMIRDYCITNNKVLYDFEKIESYDPDGAYYEFPDDNCDYYASVTGSMLGNWADEWQSSHTQNVDWYDCPSAHSRPLNANQKAYAAWWLWANLAGWDHRAAVTINFFQGRASESAVTLTWGLTSDEALRGFKIYRKSSGGESAVCVNPHGLIPAYAREYTDNDAPADGICEYFLSIVREDGTELRSQTVTVEITPPGPVLYQNYPNPFNPATRIEYQIPERSRVILKVYDARGNEVRTLANTIKAHGRHTVYWDGKNAEGSRVGSGLYFYRLESDFSSQTRKMILLR